MDSYPQLFSPLALGTKTAKNRIVSTSHATAYDDDGLITQRLVDYEAQKAAGGAGIVSVFGSASVDPDSAASFGSVRLWDSQNEELLTQLAERVHASGALLLTQATHMGRRGNTMKRGILSAPSAIPEPLHREIPHALTTGEAERIIELFADAAARLERCGFDGIELQGGGGQLIEQFFSPFLNRRSDRFGGDLRARTQFAVEVIEAISSRVSRDFLIGIKISGDPSTTDYDLSIEDMQEIAVILDGIDRIDVFNIAGSPAATNKSTARSIPSAYMPLGTNVHLATAMRPKLNAPILVAGRIVTPYQAEAVLEQGQADLIGMTRAIIADPTLPDRSQSGEFEAVRPCININEGCIGRLYKGLEVRCVVNPAVAHPDLAKIEVAQTPKRVVIIGAGPAGLEAARGSALAGHRTTLLDRASEVGGQLLAARRPEDSPRYDDYLAWVTRQLERYGVDVRLNTEATPEVIQALSPDHVVIATGAEDIVPSHIVHPRKLTDVDLYLNGDALIDLGRVLIYDVDGQGRGPQAALAASRAGATQVTLATDLMHVIADIDPTQRAPLYSRLAEAQVQLLPHMLISRDGRGLHQEWTGEAIDFSEYDTVFTVGFRTANDYLSGALDGETSFSNEVIGDAFAPRRMSDAVLEGVRAGSKLGSVRTHTLLPVTAKV